MGIHFAPSCLAWRRNKLQTENPRGLGEDKALFTHSDGEERPVGYLGPAVFLGAKVWIILILGTLLTV
jgi:hypothetical protein